MNGAKWTVLCAQNIPTQTDNIIVCAQTSMKAKCTDQEPYNFRHVMACDKNFECNAYLFGLGYFFWEYSTIINFEVKS